MTPQVTARFEALGAAPHAQRFCLWTEPAALAPNALIVYVHPFGEEMNKSRRMAAHQARAFAAAGAAVLQMDLLGCGDSAGDSGDATWVAWVDDVVAACRFVTARYAQQWPGHATPPLWLWGLRAGCLVATQAAERLEVPCRFILWQPPLSGKTLLQQFLRLDSVAAAIGKVGAAAREPARAALTAGRAVEVAGYTIAPALASGLEQARLVPPRRPGPLLWLDVSPQPAAEPFPAVHQAQEAWRQAGHAVRTASVIGPQFWQTTEIDDAPGLIDATLATWRASATEASSPRLSEVAT